MLLAAAMRSCEAAAPAGPFGRSIWLGEDWCDDPTGLVDDPVRVSVPRARGAAHGVLADLANRLRWVLSHAAARPEPGVGIAWLDTLSEQFADDARAKPMLDELAELAAERRPRVVVYGDYNAGKSSLIKRLLVDDGQPAPADLTVRGAPETAQVRTYDWLGWPASHRHPGPAERDTRAHRAGLRPAARRGDRHPHARGERHRR